MTKFYNCTILSSFLSFIPTIDLTRIRNKEIKLNTIHPSIPLSKDSSSFVLFSYKAFGDGCASSTRRSLWRHTRLRHMTKRGDGGVRDKSTGHRKRERERGERGEREERERERERGWILDMWWSGHIAALIQLRMESLSLSLSLHSHCSLWNAWEDVWCLWALVVRPTL